MSDDDKPIAKFLRLQNGDDVIAETIEMEDEDGIVYTLCHPLKVVYMPTETTGYLSVMFMPWVFPKICDEQIFTIHAEDVLLLTDVSEKMNIYYWDSVKTYTDKSQYEQEEPVSQEDDAEETLNQIMEHLGKRTMH